MPTSPAEPRILVVDDEAVITSNLSPLLKRAGFDVVIASVGEQGLSLARRQAPDLIVLDILMPRLNGREVLRTLRNGGNWTLRTV